MTKEKRVQHDINFSPENRVTFTFTPDDNVKFTPPHDNITFISIEYIKFLIACSLQSPN